MPSKPSIKQLSIIIVVSFGLVIIPFLLSPYFRETNISNILIYQIIRQTQTTEPPEEPPPVIEDYPYHFHATWSDINASITITMTWRTDETNISAIRYDITSKGGDAALYSSEKTINGTIFSGSYLYTVNLSNLQPNTTYYFVCGSDEGGWTDEIKFRTPDLQPKEIIFIAGGDSRTQVSIRNSVSDLMKNYSPEFVIHSGDIVTDGRIQSQWDTWFDGMDNYWKTNDNFTIPIIPCLGNHEYNASYYYDQFALPNNERWYSIDYSSLLHIICLDSNAPIGGEQLIWLENDLKNYNNTPWKIVFFHHPPYCEGGHTSRIDIRDTWGPIFDEYNVSIVFNGHCHLYERTNPIKNETVVDSYLNGTMYIVTGGWGAPLSSTNFQWWTNNTESCYHFCLINVTTNVDNSTLELKQIRLDNTIGDTVKIIKDLL
ncbi:MAG: metallophosphoesterase [Candidatus Hodarchaeota archaeon]